MIVDDLQTTEMIRPACEHFRRTHDVAQICRGCIRRSLWADRAFPRIEHVLRCDRAPIMKFCNFMQMEGVDRAILTDFPVLCKIGYEIQMRVERDETAKGEFIAGAMRGGRVVFAQVRGLTPTVYESLIERDIGL